MEKMREEFEAWAVKYNLARADWGNYQDRHVNNMWKAWQASRAALCVELPENWKGHALTVSELRRELDKAGVSYK